MTKKTEQAEGEVVTLYWAVPRFEGKPTDPRGILLRAFRYRRHAKTFRAIETNDEPSTPYGLSVVRIADLPKRGGFTDTGVLARSSEEAIARVRELVAWELHKCEQKIAYLRATLDAPTPIFAKMTSEKS